MALLGDRWGGVSHGGQFISPPDRQTHKQCYELRLVWTHAPSHMYAHMLIWALHVCKCIQRTGINAKAKHHAHTPACMHAPINSVFLNCPNTHILTLAHVCKPNICLMQRWRGGQPVWLWAESPCGLPQPFPLACVTGPTHAASLLPLLLSPPPPPAPWPWYK